MFRDVILGGANPGNTLGASFSASINATQLIPKGKVLDHFIIGISGAVATAPVVIENAVGVLSQFTFKAGQETRIQLSGRDLVALASFWYKELPFAWENTDDTGTTFTLGIKVPIQETIDANTTYTWAASYASVTNYTPVLAITAVYQDTSPRGAAVIAVPIPYTTAGSSGNTAPNARITNQGMLQGLIIFNTTGATDAGQIYDIQRVQMVEDGKQTSLLEASCMDPLAGQALYQTLQPVGETLQPYVSWDFRDQPYDVKTHTMEFIVDVEETSEATRIIPIITKA